MDWKGKRWILPHLFKWWKKETGYDLPGWIDKEISDEEIHKLIVKDHWEKFSVNEEVFKERIRQQLGQIVIDQKFKNTRK